MSDALLKSRAQPNNGLNPTCSSLRSLEAGYACRHMGLAATIALRA